MRRINIVIGIDGNYFFPSVVMLTSFLENVKNPVSLYVLHRSLEKKYIDEFHMLLKKYDGRNEVIEIQVDEKSLLKAPIYEHIPIETYYNILAMKYLPDEVDRAIYLDPDVIINKDIADFYFQDIENIYLVGARDMYVTTYDRDVFNQLKVSGKTEYINSGMLIINVKRIKERVDIEWYISALSTTYKTLKYADQDLLNIIFEGEIRVCSIDYNYQVPRLPKDKQMRSVIERDAMIFHFCSKNKPWNDSYKGQLSSLFWKYAEIAGYEHKKVNHCNYDDFILCRFMWTIISKITKYLRIRF